MALGLVQLLVPMARPGKRTERVAKQRRASWQFKVKKTAEYELKVIKNNDNSLIRLKKVVNGQKHHKGDGPPGRGVQPK